MKLIQRLAYYSGGFIIGLLLLFFFLGGKKASCDYGPNARTLKNIRSKERIIDEAVHVSLSTIDKDTSVISEILKSGDVLFAESNTRLDSCKIYVIKGRKELQNLRLTVENCDEKAKVLGIQID